MSEIQSTERIDELFKKSTEEGLNQEEKAELLRLLKERGITV